MAATPTDAAPATLHTVFTSECHNPQFDWFATGVYRSHRESGIRGRITRLLACGADDLAQYRGLGLGPTFVHPNYRHNPLNGDTSASYNKPGSVMHFSREANFTEEYVLFIDADMLLRAPSTRTSSARTRPTRRTRTRSHAASCGTPSCL